MAAWRPCWQEVGWRDGAASAGPSAPPSPPPLSALRKWGLKERVHVRSTMARNMDKGSPEAWPWLRPTCHPDLEPHRWVSALVGQTEDTLTLATGTVTYTRGYPQSCWTQNAPPSSHKSHALPTGGLEHHTKLPGGAGHPLWYRTFHEACRSPQLRTCLTNGGREDGTGASQGPQ